MYPEALDQNMLLLSNKMEFLKELSFYLAGRTGLALPKPVDIDSEIGDPELDSGYFSISLIYKDYKSLSANLYY